MIVGYEVSSLWKIGNSHHRLSGVCLITKYSLLFACLVQLLRVNSVVMTSLYQGVNVQSLALPCL